MDEYDGWNIDELDENADWLKKGKKKEEAPKEDKPKEASSGRTSADIIQEMLKSLPQKKKPDAAK